MSFVEEKVVNLLGTTRVLMVWFVLKEHIQVGAYSLVVGQKPCAWHVLVKDCHGCTSGWVELFELNVPCYGGGV